MGRVGGVWKTPMFFFRMTSTAFDGFDFCDEESVIGEKTIMRPGGSSRQLEATAFGRGGMRQRIAGMSPHMCVGKGTTRLDRGAPFANRILAITQPRSFEIYKERHLRCVFLMQNIITVKYVKGSLL
jgi:hypothetical protein